MRSGDHGFSSPGDLHPVPFRRSPVRPLSRFCVVSAFAGGACGAAAGQVELRFPLNATQRNAERVELSPAPERIAALAGLSRVVLTGAPLPGGDVDLELERLDLTSRRFRYRVDGVDAGDPASGQHLSIWSGHVRGRVGDRVALSFSQVGCRGWIACGAELFHVACGPGEQGDWTQPRVVVMGEASVVAAGAPSRQACGAASLSANAAAPVARPSDAVAAGTLALSPELLEARIAVETDYQRNQVFGGNLAAEAAYVTTLLTWVSYRYEEQIATVLTFPYVGFCTNSNDPWTTADVGGGAFNLLFEFQAAWGNNVPNGAHLGAFLSGAPLGGGIAWQPGLCNAPYNFSVASGINGDVAFPLAVSSGAWDFVVTAHEIGHNFGAPHTHEYCPTPADECAPNGYFGSCQHAQTCVTNGSLMSYCYQCPGGLLNMSLEFHPWSASDMRAWAASTCAPLYCSSPIAYCTAKVNSQGCTPSIDSFGHPTLTGLDDFTIAATNVLNNKSGVLYWGLSSSTAPFEGGVLCVGQPVVRTGLQLSGGDPGDDDCSGAYSLVFTHDYAQSKGLTAGTTCFAQYWTRDPASASGTGLTNALQFTLCD